MTDMTPMVSPLTMQRIKEACAAIPRRPRSPIRVKVHPANLGLLALLVERGDVVAVESNVFRFVEAK